jgi:1,4-alpha-glucan branching enzyme
VIVFNFHPVNSYTDFRVGCYKPGPYKVILSSDEEVFGGYRNVTKVGGCAAEQSRQAAGNTPALQRYHMSFAVS